MISEIASPAGAPQQHDGIAIRDAAAEELRVLKAGREILKRHPRTKVAIALNRAAGRRRWGLVLATLNRLDETTRDVYNAALFELEENLPTGSDRLLKAFDLVIAKASGAAA